MILQPIGPTWLISLLFLIICSLFGWLIFNNRKNKTFVLVWLRRLVLIMLIFVMAFRPSVPGQSRFTGNALLDIYFVVDNSVSMRAEDTKSGSPRLDLAKSDIRKIAESIPGARYSVIGFSNEATQELPLTNDSSALAVTADILKTTDRYDSSGSSIDTPLEYLMKELKRNSDNSPNRGRVLIYMGDGEQTIDKEPESFAPLKNYLSGGFVFGYGTESGGQMLDDKWGSDDQADNYIKWYGEDSDNYVSSPAISKIDQANLKNIASQLGVGYVQRSGDDGVETFINSIDVGKISRSSREVDTYYDLYWVFALIVLPLVVIDGWAYVSSLRRATATLNMRLRDEQQ